MNVFDLRERVLDDYHRYVESFLNIRDERIHDFVSQELDRGVLWPEALVQLSPSYEMGKSVSDLADNGILHPLCKKIFQKNGSPFKLYHHQEKAIYTAQKKQSYVLTTGTGSGKSLTYLVPIMDYILKNNPEPEQVRALIVYPMNALINSQDLAIKSLLSNLGDKQNLIRHGRYTGQEVAEGYGPSIQKSELVADARSQEYRLGCLRDIVEPATIDLEERDLFNEVMAEATRLKKENRCDGISFSRCDRLSRRFDAALQIALDCKKNGLALRFVRENQWLRPDDEPMQFVLFVLQAFGVHTQTGISIANMNAGRRRAAADGKLPAGVGNGMLGYTLANKKFTTNSFIAIVDEILDRALRGDSINRITGDLQARDVRTPAGIVITRSTVAVVLRHARRYAGIWDWSGYELKNLIPARISEEQAEHILTNLKRNREKSYGFGKRKWLTSRVICGICGRRYNLREKHGCACVRSDPMRACPPCSNVRIPWHRLSDGAWDTFVECITGIDALELAVKDKRRAWKAHKAKIERQVRGLQEQISRLQQKRRHYSWQQAEGIITDGELRTAHKQLKSEESIINDQLGRLEEFRGEPAPPDGATFKKLAEYWSGDIADKLHQAPDDDRTRFAELFDLNVTIRPDNSRDGYHFDLSANIPLEMEGDKPGAYDMVFGSSRGGLRG